MDEAEQLRQENRKLRDALDFVDARICAAYTHNWAEEDLKLLVYDCRDQIKAAILFRAGRLYCPSAFVAKALD